MLSRFSTVALLSSVPAITALVEPDGTGKLPALGWNSWNAFKCDVDEEKIMTAANEIVDLGLKDLGYSYVNIDDCWSIMDHRDPDTGRIIPDLEKFPSGIKGVADKIHDMGLKVGIYSSAGTETCAGYPASIGNELIDAETWAEWGIDYLKYDNCGVPEEWEDEYADCVPDPVNGGPFPNGTCPDLENPAPEGYDWTTSNTVKRYNAMRDALQQQNRTILYSLCNWGDAAVSSWGNGTGASWRMSDDIYPEWPQIAQILNQNSFLLNSVGFWGHNDPDMLEVGNGELTVAEARSHFALWAAMKSPLILGASLDTIGDEFLDIIRNEYLISFNQDEQIGEPATPYKWGYNEDWTFDPEHPAEYWSGASSEGTLVLMLNTEDETSNRTAAWDEIPELQGHGSYKVTDIWTRKSLGCISGEYTAQLESHDTAAFIVTDKC
ncbi:hypothetical protein FQN54_009845 [Arachnomyces sp. PD_36]|nr:hypothetical protein FQN54_009845 [Arachnomyces sp. PD_36]